MKPKSVAPQSAVMAVDRKLHNTWVYIKRHWQLYLLFLMPAVLLTLVFRYIPMGGVLIAFQKYNPFKGIWGSEWVGFKNAVLYSVIFTVISVAVTMLAAYPMSLPDFKGKKFFNTLFVITMFFNGGLIPTYLLINNIGLLDSMWAVILPGAFSVWNMIIARTYYQGIPRELREAADVDGASEMRYFFNILLPVCMPVVAVLALWQFVAMWNSYFDAMIYLNSASKQPLQLVLRSILIQSQPESGMIADIQSTAERAKMAELLKYATIIISSLPLLVMYPFFQKYFDAGIMAGSVKG